MTTICILILSRNPLLAYSLMSILSTAVDLRVSTSQAKDSPEILKAVDQLLPDVIVFDNLAVEMNGEVIGKLLSIHPNLHFLVVSVNNNRVHIVRKNEVLLNNAIDLVDLVHQA